MESDSEASEDYFMNDGIKRKLNSKDKTKNKRHKNNNAEDSEDEPVYNKELYKPPTVEELNQLRETEILFNSNLFRLQTEELLKEVSLKHKRRKEIDEWVELFSDFIKNIPEYNLDIAQNSKNKQRKIVTAILDQVPLNIQTDQDIKFILKTPIFCRTLGLYNVNAAVGSTVNININAVLSKSCFHEKDYLNSRYLVKRFIYLSYLAFHLKKADFVTSICYTYYHGNALIPVLKITPKSVKNCVFHILVTPEENTFKLVKFDPNKSNLRCAYFQSKFDENFKSEQQHLNTPFYNSILLQDVVISSNDIFQESLIKEKKGVCEGLVLLMIWLQQRELSEGFGGFNEDLLYAVVAYLTNINKINKHMSSYQVIRNVWNYLANSTWDTNGNIIGENKSKLSVFHKNHDLVFVDKSGHFNLAYDLDLNVYLKVKQEAKLALGYLDEGQFNSFQALFMTKMNFYLQYDASVTVFEDPAFKTIYNSVDDNAKLDHLYFKKPLIFKNIVNLIKTGLSDRIEYIVPKLKSNICWEIGEIPKENDVSFSFGIQLNFTNIFRVVDKGPPAYDAQAAKFQGFWQGKAELRRFKDGTICEAVYWPAETIQDKRKIAKQIIQFVIQEKLNINNFEIMYDQFETILKLYKTPAIEEGNLKVVATFDELAKVVRNITLPLSISTVQGISEAFCHSDAFPPVPRNYKTGKTTSETEENLIIKSDVKLMIAPKYVATVDGVIQMVHHSKWPNDLNAVKHLQAAFYIQIAEHLKNQSNIKSNPTYDYIDILYKGFVFRLSIFHHKQITLLRKNVDEKGVVFFRDSDESVQLEQNYVIVPKIIGALNGLHSQYPSFGPSTVLIKRWLNSQLIDESHISNIVIGLLNASLYLNSAPFTQAVLPQVAFFRFLKMVATQNWNIQMIVVNFNNELTREKLDEAETNFQQNRENYPALFILTPFDAHSLLTQNTASKEILHRVSVLAKECLIIIEKNLYCQDLLTVATLFKPNLSGYNVVIHLQPFLNPRRYESIFYESLKDETSEYVQNQNDKIPIIKFDPVEYYLKELRDNYGSFALFFHDNYGGNLIAVLWKPNVHEVHDFKVANVEGKMLTKDGKLEVNKDAIIEDFYILGDGLVKSIDIS